jgi:hypothetical protein
VHLLPRIVAGGDRVRQGRFGTLPVLGLAARLVGERALLAGTRSLARGLGKFDVHPRAGVVLGGQRLSALLVDVRALLRRCGAFQAGVPLQVVAGAIGIRPLVMADRQLVQALRAQLGDVRQDLFDVLARAGAVGRAKGLGSQLVRGRPVLGGARAPPRRARDRAAPRGAPDSSGSAAGAEAGAAAVPR